MADFDNQHYSPRFANKRWGDRHGKCVVYHRDRGREPHQGWKSWGQEFRLWSDSVEKALNRELETPVARIYSALLDKGEAPTGGARVNWAQFLLSQVVRTPTFIRYENWARQLHGMQGEPSRDRVGCEHCVDLHYVTGRDWAVLAAHEDDYFIRTDNPVVLTGPLERAATTIYYPLSPRWCFVALPLPAGSKVTPKCDDQMHGWSIEKGAAHMVNFYCAQQAERSLVAHPDHDDSISMTMLTDPDVLATYPQPPFLLHEPHQAPEDDIYESVRLIQSGCDGKQYPEWGAADLENAARKLLESISPS